MNYNRKIMRLELSAEKAHVDEPIVMLIPFPNPQLALLYFDFQR